MWYELRITSYVLRVMYYVLQTDFREAKSFTILNRNTVLRFVAFCHLTNNIGFGQAEFVFFRRLIQQIDG